MFLFFMSKFQHEFSSGKAVIDRYIHDYFVENTVILSRKYKLLSAIDHMIALQSLARHVWSHRLLFIPLDCGILCLPYGGSVYILRHCLITLDMLMRK